MTLRYRAWRWDQAHDRIKIIPNDVVAHRPIKSIISDAVHRFDFHRLVVAVSDDSGIGDPIVDDDTPFVNDIVVGSNRRELANFSLLGGSACRNGSCINNRLMLECMQQITQHVPYRIGYVVGIDFMYIQNYYIPLMFDGMQVTGLVITLMSLQVVPKQSQDTLVPAQKQLGTRCLTSPGFSPNRSCRGIRWRFIAGRQSTQIR